MFINCLKIFQLFATKVDKNKKNTTFSIFYKYIQKTNNNNELNYIYIIIKYKLQSN